MSKVTLSISANNATFTSSEVLEQRIDVGDRTTELSLHYNPYSIDLAKSNVDYAYLTTSLTSASDFSSDSFSLQISIKPESRDEDMVLASKYMPSTNDRAWLIYLDTDGRLWLNVYYDGTNTSGKYNVFKTTNAIVTALDIWYTFTVVYDAVAGTCTFYLNDTEVSGGTTQEIDGTDGVYDTNEVQITIGFTGA